MAVSDENSVDPLILYKYRSYTDFSEPMLRSQTLWAAKPSTLNDPFECQKTLQGLAVSAEKARQRHWADVIYFARLGLQGRIEAGEGANGLSRLALERLLDRLDKADSLDAARRVLEIVFALHDGTSGLKEPVDFMSLAERTLREVGILSLSARPDSTLMWSHYAASHTGYCLGFERSSGTALADPVRTAKVSYKSDIPELNLDELLIEKAYYPVSSFGVPNLGTKLKIETETLRHVLFRKSPEWAYEEEWRHVVERGNRVISYPGPLREVIFGLNIQEATKDSLLRALPSTDSIRLRQVVVGESGVLVARDL